MLPPTRKENVINGEITVLECIQNCILRTEYNVDKIAVIGKNIKITEIYRRSDSIYQLTLFDDLALVLIYAAVPLTDDNMREFGLQDSDRIPPAQDAI